MLLLQLKLYYFVHPNPTLCSISKNMLYKRNLRILSINYITISYMKNSRRDIDQHYFLYFVSMTELAIC
jgi:hypothetical protein